MNSLLVLSTKELAIQTERGPFPPTQLNYVSTSSFILAQKSYTTMEAGDIRGHWMSQQATQSGCRIDDEEQGQCPARFLGRFNH